MSTVARLGCWHGRSGQVDQGSPVSASVHAPALPEGCDAPSIWGLHSGRKAVESEPPRGVEASWGRRADNAAVLGEWGDHVGLAGSPG